MECDSLYRISRSIEKAIEVSRKVKTLLNKSKKTIENHLYSCLSSVDLLVALYIGYGLKKSGSKPTEHDWFILSKGHAVPAFYAMLIVLGLMKEDSLEKIGVLDGLETHFDASAPCIEVSTGSLGQGLSIAAGIAYSIFLEGKRDNHRVYVLMGDGELDEGQVWEAASTISHLDLYNVIVLVDINGLQNDGKIEDVKRKGDIAGRWRSLGWSVFEVDGHNIPAIVNAISLAEKAGSPTAILAYTGEGGWSS